MQTLYNVGFHIQPLPKTDQQVSGFIRIAFAQAPMALIRMSFIPGKMIWSFFLVSC